ncbi:heat shock 70 kDa protein 12A-like [Dreissena polymorpha]|nr:heat shock 70 kDa protein 12A-like [Dreissena polymorpha]
MPKKKLPTLHRLKTTLPALNEKRPVIEKQNTAFNFTSHQPAVFMQDENSFTYVAAIEIGTSYSGYAYAPRKDGKLIAKDIDKSLETLRTPSCLLLNEKKEFEAYGYDAERMYIELIKEGRDKTGYYFRRFRPKLIGVKDLRGDSHITDENGKTMSAMKVFTFAIRYLKSQLLNDLCLRGIDAEAEDIRWVVTVAGFTDELTKQFMRKAACQAGLPDAKVMLCLEPEAASLFCQHMPSNALSEKLPIFKSGTKYVLADIGGGLTDIAMHEKRRESLREVSRGLGTKLGAGAVDNIFVQFLYKLLGDKIADEFVNTYRKEFLGMMRDFEHQKKTVTPLATSCLELKVPPCLHVLCQKAQYNDNLSNVVFRSVYKGHVKYTTNRFVIDAVVSNEFFRAITKEMAKVINHSLTALKTSKDIHILVLTGGFAESAVVQEIMHQELVGKSQIKQIIVPPDADVAVLKGAVIYGNNPSGISCRVNRHTIGIRIARLYNPEMHPIEKRQVLNGGVEYILDVFSPFLTIGTRVPVGFVSHQALTTTEPFQKSIEIDLYESSELSHNFVTEEGCIPMGKLDFPIPDPSVEARTVFVDVILGGTELNVIVLDKKSNIQNKYHYPPLKQK